MPERPYIATARRIIAFIFNVGSFSVPDRVDVSVFNWEGVVFGSISAKTAVFNFDIVCAGVFFRAAKHY